MPGKFGYYTRFKFPQRKTERRIKLPPIEKRPVRFQLRSLIRKEHIHKNPWWFVMHRRGPGGRPHVGLDALEARAIPHGLIRGTLPERIMYAALVNLLHMVPDIDFDFQSCVAANHKILTADMRWVEAGSLVPGDELLSFDDVGSPNRAWKKGKVTSNSVEDMDAMRVTLSDGRSIVTTPNHPWLVHYSPNKRDWGRHTGYSWVETQNLKIGAYIPIFMDTWDEDNSYEAGWVSGFFDGEGSVVHAKTQTGGHSLAVTVGQNPSIMLDRFLMYIESLGYDFTVYDYTDKHQRSYDDNYRKVIHCRLSGGRAECLRFLGSVRPAKLQYLDINRLGKLTKIRQVQVIKVEPVGRVPIARLEVDEHTYVVEGFGMHNSLQGGRIDFGGIVVDFLFPHLMLVIQVQGPTHDQYIRIKKDTEQQLALEEMGYTVVGITDVDIYDEGKLNRWLRQTFGWSHVGGIGMSASSAESWSSTHTRTVISPADSDIIDTTSIADWSTILKLAETALTALETIKV